MKKEYDLNGAVNLANAVLAHSMRCFSLRTTRIRMSQSIRYRLAENKREYNNRQCFILNSKMVRYVADVMERDYEKFKKACLEKIRYEYELSVHILNKRLDGQNIK